MHAEPDAAAAAERTLSQQTIRWVGDRSRTAIIYSGVSQNGCFGETNHMCITADTNAQRQVSSSLADLLHNCDAAGDVAGEIS